MSAPTVQHLADENRYEFRDGEAHAILTYQHEGDRIVYDHTFVPVDFRGQGVAEKLVEAALADARKENLTVMPQCSYVATYIARHSQHQDLLSTRS